MWSKVGPVPELDVEPLCLVQSKLSTLQSYAPKRNNEENGILLLEGKIYHFYRGTSLPAQIFLAYSITAFTATTPQYF